VTSDKFLIFNFFQLFTKLKLTENNFHQMLIRNEHQAATLRKYKTTPMERIIDITETMERILDITETDCVFADTSTSMRQDVHRPISTSTETVTTAIQA
jgi:hypothetical protein